MIKTRSGQVRFSRGKGKVAFFPGKGLTRKARSQVKTIIKKTADIGILDTVIDDTDVTFANAPFELTLIAEGDTDTSRDGQQIQLNSLQYKIMTKLGASQTVTSTIRFIIFRWNRQSAPATNSILTLSGGIDAPIFPLNVTTSKGEYQILHTKTFVCSASGDSEFFNRHFEKFMKVKGKVTYSGAATTTGIKGRIFAQFISDITANGPRILASFRLRYSK